MHKIYALWCHPRSMSTAMERIMRERGDLKCFHEPFMYDYYINREAGVMPHFEPDKDHPVTYDEVRDMLLQTAETSDVFLKDMSYYVLPRIIEDKAIKDHLVNFFLIRDPMASILSYHKLDPNMSQEEIGLEAQAKHLNALIKQTGETPVVVQAEDVRANPQKTLGTLWSTIGLSYSKQAFDWQSKQPEDWEQVGEWHSDVSASNSIHPITHEEVQNRRDEFETLRSDFPKLQTYYDHHLPYYEYLKSHAIVQKLGAKKFSAPE